MGERCILFMKRLFVLYMFLIVLLSTGCNQNNEEGTVMKIALFPSGTNSLTYLFTLDTNGYFQVFYGERRNDQIEKSDFLLKIEKKEIKELTEDQMEIINQLKNKIKGSKDFDLGERFVADTWEAIIFYDNHKYHFLYYFDDKIEYKNLIDAFIQFSPIKIDLIGFS